MRGKSLLCVLAGLLGALPSTAGAHPLDLRSTGAETAPAIPESAQDTLRVTIQGTVIDSRSGRPIPDVEVALAELGVILMTDSAGSFLLPDLALGTYRLALQKDGYERVEGPLQVLRAGGMVIRLDPLVAAGGPVAATAVPGSSRIRGIVKDAGSGAPLEGALVTIEGVRRNQITDVDGRFALSDVPAGRRRIEVSLLGFATRADAITVPPASILALDIALTIEPIPLAPITVAVEPRNLDLELAGFYERQDRERGIFFTQEMIEERNPVTIVDLFEGLPGVRIVVQQGIRRAVSLVANRGMSIIDYTLASPYGTPCYPAVWLNGMMVHAGADTVPEHIEDLATPGNVAGLEIYPSAARIPVQYNIAGACGVIVIWTRRD